MANPETFADDAMPFMNQLFATAMRMTRNRADAEDLVQETFLKGYRAYERFEAGTNLRAWLFRILTNSYINTYRKKQRRPKQSDLEDVQDLYIYRRLGGNELSAIGRSAEDQLFDQITDSTITDALDELPEQYRTAVMLADVEGFAYKEIAEILDIPIGTVMSRLHRGRKKLQEQLYEFGRERGFVDAPVVEETAVSEQAPVEVTQMNPDQPALSPKGPDMNFGSNDSDPLNTGRMNAGSLNAQPHARGDCQPLSCDKAMNCIDGVRDPVATPYEMSNLRSQLIDCPPCLQAFDMEVKLKTTIAPSTSELPSADFRMRITETLASVDLSKLEITDFG